MFGNKCPNCNKGKIFEKGLLHFSFSFPKMHENCSNCGKIVKKSLSTRTHVCSCGCQLDRDENAAKNILRRGLSTAGHTGTFGLEPINALGELTSTLAGEILLGQVDSLNKESPVTSLCD